MVNCNAHDPCYNLFQAEMTESASYICDLHACLSCTDSPSVAVVRCKMRDLFVVVVLIATLVSQGTAQLPCKL